MTAVDLPIQSTPFVGRTHELAEIVALFDNPDCRLVTLVGPGGIGKTRLALEVGAVLRQRKEPGGSVPSAQALVPDGVYFVALQPINAPEFITSAIAEAVGIRSIRRS
jgi:predicted ATPase